MKLEKAYSIDLKKDITPAEADDQFQQGNIRSKFKFKCPDEKCNAQVTCANLDRPKHLRKREPYYKVVGNHHVDCLIAKDIKEQPAKKQIYDIYRPEDKPIEGAFRINLQPPSTKKIKSGNSELDKTNHTSHSKLSGNQTSHSQRQIQSSKTLSSIIDSFLNNETIDIDMPNIGKISIQELFIEVNGQDISDFPDEWRIYYGKAWFNQRDEGFSVKFANELSAGEIKKKPSFYISNTALANSGFAKFNQQKMIEIANKKPKQVFLLSETGPYLKDDKFINIWCEAPHFMDYRL